MTFQMKTGLIYLIVISLIFYSCKPTGVKYADLSMIEDSAGSTIEENDFVSLNYTEKTEDGELIAGPDLYDDYPAMIFVGKQAFKKDFSSMLHQLSEGDSACFKIRIDSMIQKQGRRFPQALKGTYLIYTVRINRVIKRGNQTDREYDLAIEKYKQQSLDTRKEQEDERIERYIAESPLHFSKSPSGLFYAVTKYGIGSKPRIGDSIIVNYTGLTMNGEVFETSDPQIAKENNLFDGNTRFIPFRGLVSNAKPVSGFNEALRMFPKMTEVTLIIPSKLAYGAKYYKILKPFTPIVCKLEILMKYK